MKRKIILSAVMIAVLAAGIFAIITIKNNSSNRTESFDTMEDALKTASFNMDYPDRLGGYPATVFASDSSTVEVQYGNGGFIRKTLGVNDNSGGSTKYGEVNEENINGLTVTLKGDDGLIYLAAWNDNNFAYTVKVNKGISVDEMTEYIEATR